MKKLLMLSALMLLLAFNASYAGVDSQNNCVPPGGGGSVPGGPEYVGQFHATYPNGANVYDLTQPQHSMFTNCDPPPPTTGSTTVHSFGSRIQAHLSVNGGPDQMIDAPAQVTVQMTKTGGADNQTGTFQTEMLQLDIQGGNLPPGVMIRESPTLQSTGQTSISHNGTGYHIDSFFDIFTELSVDGGATWHPSTAGPGHMTLSPGANTIPTLNQWGLIIFSLLILGTAIVFVRRRQMA
jgi:hypothetical protein